MQIRPLFLRTSGSSGVLKALLLERIDNCPVTQKKKVCRLYAMGRERCES